MKKNLHITVSGRVQNVAFRYHTRQMAEIMGVCGYVKNKFDGSVFIEVEGEEEKVNDFTSWCRQGPPRATVDDIEIESGEIQNYTEFKVRF